MATILTATDLRRQHVEDGTTYDVLRRVHLELEGGELVTVMGPSGSGKSTLLHCLSGLDRPTAGRVVLAGHDLFALGEKARTLLRRRHVGFVFQFFNLLPDLTVEENVTLPLLIDGRDPAHDRQRLDELLAALDLDRLRRRQPHGLSGGEMQRVSIARALAARPPLLFADEPTGNLSSRAGEETMRLLRQVNERFGTTILLVTHNPRDAAFGDRVLFLKDGVLDPAHAMKGPGLDAALVFARLEELAI
jgi:putative ABC transport system ATP-binding protein